MKTTCSLMAWLGVVGPTIASVVMTTETPVLFDLDTTSARLVASRSEPVALPYGEGATLTATDSSGTVTTLAPAVNGTNWWTATSGGIWTLSNSNEGQTTFAVRYTAAEQGAGTAASPWKFVDNDELGELAVTDGFTFVAEGPMASVGSMARPTGFAFRELGSGVFQTVTATGGAAYITADSSFVLDTDEAGPDRKGRKRDPWPEIAYTGDGWLFAPSATSTLTVAPPSGTAASEEHTGTGTVAFAPRMTGMWTVSLEYNATSLTASINVIADATVLFVK